jgi:cell division septation protein DedD
VPPGQRPQRQILCAAHTHHRSQLLLTGVALIALVAALVLAQRTTREDMQPAVPSAGVPAPCAAEPRGSDATSPAVSSPQPAPPTDLPARAARETAPASSSPRQEPRNEPAGEPGVYHSLLAFSPRGPRG